MGSSAVLGKNALPCSPCPFLDQSGGSEMQKCLPHRCRVLQLLETFALPPTHHLQRTMLSGECAGIKDPSMLLSTECQAPCVLREDSCLPRSFFSNHHISNCSPHPQHPLLSFPASVSNIALTIICWIMNLFPNLFIASLFTNENLFPYLFIASLHVH